MLAAIAQAPNEAPPADSIQTFLKPTQDLADPNPAVRLHRCRIGQVFSLWQVNCVMCAFFPQKGLLTFAEIDPLADARSYLRG